MKHTTKIEKTRIIPLRWIGNFLGEYAGNHLVKAFNYDEDDGTIVPTAAGGSIPFAPEEALSSLWYMKNQFGDKLYKKYGFGDAFNLTYQKEGWFNEDYLGIDQGPILIQMENYDSGLIWKTLRKNPHIIKGLRKAGFSVYAGEQDRFGWLTGVIEFKTGKIIFG